MRNPTIMAVILGLGAGVGSAYAAPPLPGSPADGLTVITDPVVILDDSLDPALELTVIAVPLPVPVNAGFVILMENGGAVTAQSQWNSAHLLPPQDQWSDMIHFYQGSTTADFMSWDAPPQVYPTPTSTDQVLFLDEAVGPLESNPGVYTTYQAHGGAGLITYSIESSVPEPASLALLALGGIALLRRRRS